MGKRFCGTVIKWNDDKGYGFISPDADAGDRIFLHVSDTQLGRRPAVGDVLEFDLQRQPDGKMRAVGVRVPGVKASPETKLDRKFIVALVLCLAGSLALSLIFDLFWLLFVYPVASVICFMLYGADKDSSTRGGWRISERALHAFELMGGWPGALLGQRVFRHKTVKSDYQDVFRIIVAAHAVAWIIVLVLVPFYGDEVRHAIRRG
jgi:uncharacterized membrane protein YsdA (DUF1294 family)/cold shock CspA family protein